MARRRKKHRYKAGGRIISQTSGYTPTMLPDDDIYYNFDTGRVARRQLSPSGYHPSGRFLSSLPPRVDPDERYYISLRAKVREIKARLRREAEDRRRFEGPRPAHWRPWRHLPKYFAYKGVYGDSIHTLDSRIDTRYREQGTVVHPWYSLVCIRRAGRRAVLFALGMMGRGSGARNRKPKFTETSKIVCK